MDGAQEPEVRGQAEMLSRANEKEECAMCKFVLLFAVAVLLLVIVFVFIVRIASVPETVPLAHDAIPRLSEQEWDQRIMELKRTALSAPRSHATDTPTGQHSATQ